MDTLVSTTYRELNGKQQTFLDCFRIAAALCVLIGHSLSYFCYPEDFDTEYFCVLADFGVVMFFLLSGFLSAYALEKRNTDHTYSFRGYAMHKLKRIMREYLPALLFVAALDAAAIRISPSLFAYYDTYNLKTFLANLVFLHWTVLNRLPGINLLAFGSAKPLWTLTLEWYFYLIHGLLFLALRNRKQLRVPELVILAASLLLVIEYIVGGRGGGLGFLFALGAFGYYFFDRLDRRVSLLLFPGCLVLSFVYCVLKKNAYSIYIFLFSWFLLCAGLQLLSGPTQKKRRRFTAYLSGSCFMLYLLHFSILNLLAISPVLPLLEVKFVVGLLLSIGISCGMYSLFGRRKLLSALFPRRK